MKPKAQPTYTILDFANTLCPQNYFQTTPSNCPSWRNLFDSCIFHDKYWITEWCNARASALDIAAEVGKHVTLSLDEILNEMRNGCRDLSFNRAVLDYACSRRRNGRKTAIVTLNIDWFTEIVVPAHNLESVFDVIVNSSDYGTDDKEYLWEIAFDQLGIGAGYGTALLIDDSAKWVGRFRNNGGNAYQYSDDPSFAEWFTQSGRRPNSKIRYGGERGSISETDGKGEFRG